LKTFRFTVLGSSSAVPTSKRFTTACVLNIHEQFFLFDCGEGAQIQARRAKVKFGKLNHIFISHLHGDHYFGLFGLLSSLSLLGRTSTLNIYGPKGLDELVMSQFSNINYQLGFNIKFHEIDNKSYSKILDTKTIEVYALPLKHKVPCSGFLVKEKPLQRNIIKEKIEEYNISIRDIRRIKDGEDLVFEDGTVISNDKLTIEPEKPRSFAFCSDTMYNEEIIPYIESVDLLYHEATFPDEMQKRAAETMHSTAREAGIIARKAKARKLILGHFSARYKTLELFEKEAKEEFKDVFLAEDLSEFDVD
jgi:ribonuclease Z